MMTGHDLKKNENIHCTEKNIQTDKDVSQVSEMFWHWGGGAERLSWQQIISPPLGNSGPCFWKGGEL